MQIFISESDKQNARSVALKNIARYFSISGWEYKSNDSLKSELNTLSNPEAKKIIKLLNDYFSAYDDWFDFYQKKQAIEVEREMDYELNSSEQQELQELIDKRESTLADLQNEFDRLQLRRFNLNQFGTELTGIIK